MLKPPLPCLSEPKKPLDPNVSACARDLVANRWHDMDRFGKETPGSLLKSSQGTQVSSGR